MHGMAAWMHVHLAESNRSTLPACRIHCRLLLNNNTHLYVQATPPIPPQYRQVLIGCIYLMGVPKPDSQKRLTLKRNKTGTSNLCAYAAGRRTVIQMSAAVHSVQTYY
jgi:hypothetical protein